MKTIERVWEKVEVGQPDECWPWAASKSSGGYGIVRVGGRTTYAHRLIEEDLRGPLLPGEVVAHTCDWPPCCNPAHFRRGSQSENMIECRDRGRLNSRPLRGRANGNAKLTDELVTVMRIEALALSQRKVGSLHGIPRSLAHRVIRHLAWAHVPAVR